MPFLTSTCCCLQFQCHRIFLFDAIVRLGDRPVTAPLHCLCWCNVSIRKTHAKEISRIMCKKLWGIGKRLLFLRFHNGSGNMFVNKSDGNFSDKVTQTCSYGLKYIFQYHYVKGVRIRSYPGPYCLAFGLNTARYSEILPECGKIRTRITPNTDNFYAVYIIKYISMYLTDFIQVAKVPLSIKPFPNKDFFKPRFFLIINGKKTHLFANARTTFTSVVDL